MTLATGALGALAAAFVAYIITWSASFVGRLFDAPVAMFYEEKERVDALRQQLTELKNSFQYRLSATVELEELKKKPDGRIRIENMSDGPLEYGPAVFNVAFPNGEPKVIHGHERIVRPRQVVYYLFEFDETAMTKGRGSVAITADIDYGSPDTRTRRLHKEIEAEYTVDGYGFITRWAAVTHKDQEIAISG